MDHKEYLNFIRAKNKEIMSKCHYCEGFAINIEADGYAIRPVCKIHDTRSLDEIEKNINLMFENQKDFE
jgi:hypothetical protein